MQYKHMTAIVLSACTLLPLCAAFLPVQKSAVMQEPKGEFAKGQDDLMPQELPLVSTLWTRICAAKSKEYRSRRSHSGAGSDKRIH